MERKLRILVVDDNEEFCEIVSELVNMQPDMENLGSAHDGGVAVDMIMQKQPDIVLLDIIIPGMDGLSVLECIREKKMLFQPRFIMMSAMCKDGIIRNAIDLGASYFLNKPVSLGLLLEKIRDLAPDIYQTAPAFNSFEFEDEPAAQTAGGQADETEITGILHEIGMQKDLKGYDFTKDAILMLLEDMHLRNEITKGVYPAIAQKYDTTPQRVASAIRKVIGNSWNVRRENFVRTIYGSKASHKIERPTNLEFITTIAERLHLNIY